MESKIIMRSKYVLLALIVAAAVSGLTQTVTQGQASSARAGMKDAAVQRVSRQIEDGRLVFQQQCSRCHNAPEGFPQSISGTIIRHMRVRASLSKSQEDDLLRFLNP